MTAQSWGNAFHTIFRHLPDAMGRTSLIVKWKKLMLMVPKIMEFDSGKSLGTLMLPSSDMNSPE